jgi:5-methylcytosine-specific restriction endonuclease McrA
MRNCTRCGKELSKGAIGLCRNCYATRKSWQPPIVYTCPKCNRTSKYLYNGMCAICNSANYVKNHRKETTDRERERRHKNIERYREVDQKRNQSEARKAWKREYRRLYYAKNKDKLQAYNREWMKAHKEEMGRHHANRRSRKKQLPCTLTQLEWQEILVENGYRCFYCGATDIPLNQEHKIPVSRGGGYTRENIVPACGSCNSQKSFRTPEEFAEYLKEKSK